jgi:mannose/fructose-specific phosphotransferase system component IIA
MHIQETGSGGSERPGIRCLLVTHGDLGKELLGVVESILGPQEGVRVLTNTGASAESLQREIDALLRDMGPGPTFIFVDLLGGSCGQVCLSVQRDHADAFVISGVNLPMLVEFAHKRKLLEPQDLVSQVLKKGREGIRCPGTRASS